MATSIGLVVVFIAPSEQSAEWWMSFEPVEYRLRVCDERKVPLCGVSLDVIDENGIVAIAFPITDYFGKNTLISDAKGEILFHHVRTTREFSGRAGTRAFGLFSFKEGSIFKYKILLSHEGKSRYLSFNDLNREAVDRLPELATVRRIWTWDERSLQMPARLLPSSLEPTSLEFFVYEKEFEFPQGTE